MIYKDSIHELWKHTAESHYLTSHWKPSILGSQIIESFFLIDNRDNQLVPAYILPDICPHIVIHEFSEQLNDKIQIKLIGPRTTGFLINRKNRKRTFIVRLKPDALFKLFKIPACEFKDQSAFLMELLPHRKNALKKIQFLINDKKHPFLIFSTFEKTLLTELLNHFPKQLPCFIEFVSNNLPNVQLKNASDHIGVSERYLRKICSQHIGLPPKRIVRIKRFTLSLKKRLCHPNYTWSDIAHLSGYVDHSHMIAEYQQLMGRTPVQMFS